MEEYEKYKDVRLPQGDEYVFGVGVDMEKDIENESKKAINIINEVFFKQVSENSKYKFWFEINYDDTQKLKQAIEVILNKLKEDI